MNHAGSHLRRTRTVLFCLSVVLFGTALAGAARAETGDGVSATGATVDKLGWWHEKNVATDTPAAVVTVPPPPGVPEGSLAVGAVNGEPDKVAAVGIVPDAGLGDTVSSFTLTMRESAPPAGNVNAEAAKLVACPITSFWVAAENGTWDTRPAYDCDLAAAPGVRSPEGVWTFDLVPVAQVWLAPDSTVAADGVVLVEAVDSPEGFQTVLDTSGEGAITVAFSATPGASEDPLADAGSFDSGGSTADFSSGGGSIGLDSPSLGLPNLGLDPTAPAAPAPPTTEAAAGPEAPAAPTTIAATSPNVLGNLPPGVALLGALLLALAGLMTYTLGPAGEPAVATRQRGVSRALAARARAGSLPHSSLETR
jgi:hypothetical protein